MRYAYCINGFEDFNANIDLACEAEEAGWDGFFLPDGLALEVPDHGAMPLFDPWVIMGAIAVKTTCDQAEPLHPNAPPTNLVMTRMFWFGMANAFASFLRTEKTHCDES